MNGIGFRRLFKSLMSFFFPPVNLLTSTAGKLQHNDQYCKGSEYVLHKHKLNVDRQSSMFIKENHKSYIQIIPWLNPLPIVVHATGEIATIFVRR
jgi:hypothetical protein